MELNEIYLSDSHNIELTVALPIYNSKKIAWLALESLSNQIDITFDWELIVYEEEHDQSCCPQLLEEYKKRLIENNCKRIILITKNEKVFLTEKWIEMSKNSDSSSEVFLFHGADDYSPNLRLKESYDKVVLENFDWYDQRKVYFYSFLSGKIIIYDKNGSPNVNMATKTKYVRDIPNTNLKRGIDGYLYKKISNKINGIKKYTSKNLYNDALDTHGLNNISNDRESLFYTRPDVFTITNLELKDLSLPNEINGKLRELTEYTQSQLNKTEGNLFQNGNVLQPKVRIRKRKNEVVNPTPSSLTQFNLTKSNINKLTTQNNNKGPQSVGKISR